MNNVLIKETNSRETSIQGKLQLKRILIEYNYNDTWCFQNVGT